MKLVNKKSINKINHYKQSGFVMIVTLLALVIMLLASVALIRSTDTNLVIAGNMAFKRDLINQAERAIPVIQTVFLSGALQNSAQRTINVLGSNYYATIQANNDSGIPTAALAAVGAANDISDAISGVTIRYVIDRMCLQSSNADEKNCTLGGSNGEGQGISVDGQASHYNYFPIYRITLRATGPRNTQAYLQTTYSDK